MMTKLNADGTPMPTKKHTMERILEMVKNIEPDPVITKLMADNGGVLTVGAIANSKDISEADKTLFLGTMGYKYP